MARLNPKTFNDVKVFAGVSPASDASYKNLVWENLPVPDILFHADTPTIVSIECEVWVEGGKENIKLKLSLKILYQTLISSSILSWFWFLSHLNLNQSRYIIFTPIIPPTAILSCYQLRKKVLKYTKLFLSRESEDMRSLLSTYKYQILSKLQKYWISENIWILIIF